MKTSRRRLPSLNALIAFEATARHRSVTRAAQELALTESAVSRQILSLEAQLGIRLFNRVKKRMVLNRTGQIYSNQVTQILERIEREALELVAHEGEGGVLELTALPTVASQWLIPHLGEFHEQHPEISINLSAHSKPFLFEGTKFDGALYFGRPTWPGARTDYLFPEELVPIGRPELLPRGRPADPRDLAELPLLHLVTRSDAWRNWFALAGIVDVNAMRGRRFELQSMLISAACAGLGVALLPRFLIVDQLRAGLVTILSDLTLQSDGAYYFASPEEKIALVPLNSFRKWLTFKASMFRGAPIMPSQTTGQRNDSDA